MNNRSRAYVNIYMGDNEDDATASHQTLALEIIPRIGDIFSFCSTRDENREYVHEYAEEVFQGVVKRIEHILEERGKCPGTWHHVHFIDIFLEPIKITSE